MTRTLTVVTCAIAFTGCGGSSTSPAPNQATAVVQMTATPQVITAAVCPPSHCGSLAGQLEVEATIAIRETAGVAAMVGRLALTVRRRSDNAAIAATDQAQGTRIGAGGSTTVPIALHFDATAAESNMKIVVVFEGSDANGHQITSTIEIEVRGS
jgi:hypothetical protein